MVFGINLGGERKVGPRGVIPVEAMRTADDQQKDDLAEAKPTKVVTAPAGGHIRPGSSQQTEVSVKAALKRIGG